MVMEITSKDTKSYVNKHVDLILCANNMTLNQRKAFNFLLHHAMPSLMDENTFQINVRDIAKRIGYTSRDYLALADSIDKLGDIKIKHRAIEGKTKPEDMISINITLMPTVVCINGVCTYSYNEQIKKQLAYPGIYGRIDLDIQAEIKSTYGLVLYEICEKYKKIGHTGWISISDLRQLMGVKENSYKLFADFEKRVLNKAITEVNSKTPFKVDVQKERLGKSVSKIKFFISRNKIANSSNLDETEEADINNTDKNIYNVLVQSFGVKENVAADICTKHDEEYINQQISIIRSSESYKAGNIRNLGGQIVSAIKANYKPSKSSRESVRQEQSKKLEMQKEKDKEEKRQQNLKDYLKYIKHEVELYLESISDDIEKISRVRDSFINFCEKII